MAEKRLRPSIAETASSYYTDEKIQEFLASLSEAKKKTWLDCPHCKRRSLVEVPDDPARATAFLKVAEFLEGKASNVDAETGGLTIIVKRNTPPIGHAGA